MARSRKFNSKVFYFWKDFGMKKDAQTRARGLRWKGVKVRVVEIKGGWAVYTRPLEH